MLVLNIMFILICNINEGILDFVMALIQLVEVAVHT